MILRRAQGIREAHGKGGMMASGSGGGLATFLVAILLSWPLFVPSIANIGSFDEAYYVNNGRLILEGRCPEFAANPGVAAFYALLSLPFHHSPSWMLWAAAAGHLVIVVLLWVAAFRLATEVDVPPLLVALLLLAVPAWTKLLENSSDGLYAALSALALARTLAYARTGAVRDLGLASLFVGLAVLLRNDGLFLLPALLVAVAATRPQTSWHRRGIVAGVVPFLAVLACYFAPGLASKNGVAFGLARRTYDAFEQGEGVAHAELYIGKNAYVEGYAASRRLYGSGEDNGFSVIRAIRRNPAAFFERVKATTRKAPGQILSAYGVGNWAVGFVVLLLSGQGAVRLITQKRRATLVLLTLWSLNLLAYVLTFYREGYFLLSCVQVYALAALGAVSLVDHSSPAIQRALWTLVLCGVGLYGASRGETWFLPVSLAPVIVLWASVGYARRLVASCGDLMARHLLACAMVLPLALLTPHYSGFVATPVPPRLGSTAQEQGARFLEKTLPRGSSVATYSLLAVMLARMHHEPIHADAAGIGSAADLASWLRQREVRAVYVDALFRRFEPQICAMVDSLEGTGLVRAFSSESGHVEVFLVCATKG